MLSPDLSAALPNAKDVIVYLSLPDGAGGFERFKTHLGNLIRHSEFFAAAARQGTQLKVRNGAYALDCSCQGFDKLLTYMRPKGELPLDLSIDDLAALHKLGSALDMSEDFWRALALHPAARRTKTGGGGGLCNGGGCNSGGGGSCGRQKGILKRANCGGGSGTKRSYTAAEVGMPPTAPRAKAYRRVLVDDMADAALGDQPFFNGEWYGKQAEMRVVDTYDAAAPDHDNTPAEKQESSSTGPERHARNGAGPQIGKDGGSGCDANGTANAEAAQAAAAADALLGGQPLLHVRRFALLEFTFGAGGS